MAEPTQIAHWLLQDLTATVTTYANDKAATMIGIIGPCAALLLAMYVMLWGAGIASGQIAEPFTDGAKRIIRMCAIVAFALTIGIYQGTVANFFLSVPASMATEIAANGSVSKGDAAGIADVLDASLSKGLDIGGKVWDEGDKKAEAGIKAAISAVPFYILAITIDLAAVLIVAIGAAILFVAFVALAMLLAIGPLFILLAIFQQTQRFFEAWIGQVVSYCILYLLVAVTIGLTFAMFDKFIADLPVSDLGEITISALKLIGAVIAIVAVMIQTRSIAAGLGGGVALAAQNLAGRLAGGGTSLARAGMTGNSRSGIAASPSRFISGQNVMGATRRAAAASRDGQAIAGAYARARRHFSTNSVSGG